MSDKITNNQYGMFLFFICSSIYLGISDLLLVNISNKQVLISMVLGTILGIIPIYMFLKIQSCYENLNIFEKVKKIFGNVFGNIINAILFIINVVFLILSIRSTGLFLTSKYLQNTSFYLVVLLEVVTCLIICFKGINTIFRISQITFLINTISSFLMQLSLIQFIDIYNIFPIYKGDIQSVIKCSVYFAATTSLLVILLLSINKNKIKNPKKFNKTIIFYYLASNISLIIVMFFIISCFGYNLSAVFRYPEYILLKKISLSDYELHLENILSFRWIFYMISLCNISIYNIMCITKNKFKKNKHKLFTVIICIICIILSELPFKSITNSLVIIKKYYVYFYLIPMLLLLFIIFLGCIIKKKNT